MDPSSVTRADVVREARALIDAPFRHQGRTPEGIDCVGLLIYIAHKLDLSTFDILDYTAIPDGVMMLRSCNREMRRVPLDKFLPGDVLLFRNRGNAPQHLAIAAPYFAGGISIIHAHKPDKRVLETRLSEVWRHFLVGAYAFPGIV